MLTEEKLEKISTRLGTSSRNHRLDPHSKQACLHHQHKMQQKCCICIYVIHRLYDTDHEATLNFMNWYPHVAHAKEIYLTLLFTSEAYFISVIHVLSE